LIKIRFRNFAEEDGDFGRLWFKELIELATSDKVEIVKSSRIEVDLEITGPYNADSDNFQTPFIKRLKRLAYITVSNGRHLAYKNLAAGIQPLKTAKKNIWFTGENTRPPQGNWDLYMSFDANLSDRTFYMPLWVMTCTNLLGAYSHTIRTATFMPRACASIRFAIDSPAASSLAPLTRKPDDNLCKEVANELLVVDALRCALIDSTFVLIVIAILKLLKN